MKITITAYFLLFLTLNIYSQHNDVLQYTFNEENVIAGALDGSWKSTETENVISFQKDTEVLKIIPTKFNEFLETKIIYHAGYLMFNDDKKLAFVLIENAGNPHILYFREKGNDPLGDAESFNLFIATKETKNEDKLYIGGDSNNQAFEEFIRIR